MLKACGWFGVATMTFFIAYTAIANQVEPTVWYIIVLWNAFLLAALFFLFTGIVILWRIVNQRLHPLTILDDIKCAYWPKEKQLEVTLWICDYSKASEFQAICTTHFGEQNVAVNDKIQLDGTYFELGRPCRGNGKKRMIEFRKNNVVIIKPNKCSVTIKVKPLGAWASKRMSKDVDVLIVNH